MNCRNYYVFHSRVTISSFFYLQIRNKNSEEQTVWVPPQSGDDGCGGTVAAAAAATTRPRSSPRQHSAFWKASDVRGWRFFGELTPLGGAIGSFQVSRLPLLAPSKNAHCDYNLRWMQKKIHVTYVMMIFWATLLYKQPLWIQFDIHCWRSLKQIWHPMTTNYHFFFCECWKKNQYMYLFTVTAKKIMKLQIRIHRFRIPYWMLRIAQEYGFFGIYPWLKITVLSTVVQASKPYKQEHLYCWKNKISW